MFTDIVRSETIIFLSQLFTLVKAIHGFKDSLPFLCMPWHIYLSLLFFFLQNHTSNCEYLKIPCVHCGMMVKKADLTDHLQNECVFRLETCRFCKKQIPLNRMKVHSSDLLSSHGSCDLIRQYFSVGLG